MSHLGIFVYNPTDIKKKIAILIRNIYEKKKIIEHDYKKINI